MGIYFQFPSGWWIALGIIYIPYTILLLQRKSYKNKMELKGQIIFGFIALLIAFVIEVAAIKSQIWTYFPGNWPIVLWPAYFGGGLLSFQLIKKIEELV